MQVFVARQPILTTDKKIFGYELLFRNSLENFCPDIDGDTATSSILANTFLSFELNDILGGKPGLINFTKKMILQKTALLFPQKHIIIEILENIEPDEDIISSLKEIHNEGYTLALDDFIYHEKFEPIIELCKIIKFDLFETPLESLPNIINNIQANHNIILLAEKVETYKEFELAKEMGFTLFQGYFFSKPEIFSKEEISSNQITIFKLINETGRTDCDFNKVERLIKNDLSISFRLLKFINSAYFHRSTPVNTIKDAMTFLGVNALKKFIYIVSASTLNADKPNELLRASVIRARLCEKCGALLNTPFTTDELFTLGLFSYIDAMLDKSMDDILQDISFPEKIKTALLGKNKSFKTLLELISTVEKGEWDSRPCAAISGTRIENKLPEFYIDAIKMADSFMSQ